MNDLRGHSAMQSGQGNLQHVGQEGIDTLGGGEGGVQVE